MPEAVSNCLHLGHTDGSVAASLCLRPLGPPLLKWGLEHSGYGAECSTQWATAAPKPGYLDLENNFPRKAGIAFCN